MNRDASNGTTSPPRQGKIGADVDPSDGAAVRDPRDAGAKVHRAKSGGEPVRSGDHAGRSLADVDHVDGLQPRSDRVEPREGGRIRPPEQAQEEAQEVDSAPREPG